MFLRNVFAGLVFLTPLMAFAGESDQQHSQISLDDLKAKCTDILANPQMVKPKVKITCNDLSYYWTPAASKTGDLANTRNVAAAVQMKGYQVGQQFFPQDAAATTFQCLQFVKVERQVHNVDVELSCENLAEVADLGAFCAPIIDSAAAQDPGLIETRPTQEVQSFCPPSAH